jgi:hypothetical protein
MHLSWRACSAVDSWRLLISLRRRCSAVGGTGWYPYLFASVSFQIPYRRLASIETFVVSTASRR